MSKIKKTIIGMLSLTSSLLFAGTMGEPQEYCAFGNVSVPCEDPSWGLSVQALYLQPIYSANITYNAGIIYPGLFTLPAPPDELRFQYNEVKAEAGFGFLLEGYYRTETGNDLTVNWQHFNSSVTRDLFGAAYLDINLLLASISRVQSSIDPQWNALNFEMGQKVYFGDSEFMRFHAGLAAVEFKRNSAANILVIAPPDIQALAFNNLRFRGLGPRAGLDMSYHFNTGITIYGKGAVALIFGDSAFTNQFINISMTSAAEIQIHGKQNVMVPELELKLGISYTCEMAQGDVTVDLGGMAINYFNALQSAQIGLERSPVAVPQLFSSDFALVGGYLGIKWVAVV